MQKIEGNCQTEAYVDFGEGNVKIRCTEKGPHVRCVCYVEFNKAEHAQTPKKWDGEIVNIFDKDALPHNDDLKPLGPQGLQLAKNTCVIKERSEKCISTGMHASLFLCG